jgi:hypothetical protein
MSGCPLRTVADLQPFPRDQGSKELRNLRVRGLGDRQRGTSQSEGGGMGANPLDAIATDCDVLIRPSVAIADPPNENDDAAILLASRLWNRRSL